MTNPTPLRIELTEAEACALWVVAIDYATDPQRPRPDRPTVRAERTALHKLNAAIESRAHEPEVTAGFRDSTGAR